MRGEEKNLWWVGKTKTKAKTKQNQTKPGEVFSDPFPSETQRGCFNDRK
jgi:hypothetical protein